MRTAAAMLLVVALGCASVPIEGSAPLPTWTELSRWTPSQIASDPEGALEAARRDELRCGERIREVVAVLQEIRRVQAQLERMQRGGDLSPRCDVGAPMEDTACMY